MSKIEIKTLSPIHVGNGTFLQKGNDFIVVSTPDGDSDIYVLSVNKLGKAVGTDVDTISRWTNAIQRGEAEEFIKNFIRGEYRKYSQRRITNFASFGGTNGTLKECIHDGNGKPYIPGSSIKGAIRTAVMAVLVGENALTNMKYSTLSGMENRLFGEMGSSAFRYLCTGDAFFDNGAEIALRQINLNITQRNRLLDTSKQQIVEAISEGEVSSFRLNVGSKFFEKLQRNNLRSLKDLFFLINQHTRMLVEKEIEFWSDKGDDAKDYIERMNAMLNDIMRCSGNERCECILRLGQGVGWCFITGAWLEQVDEDYFYNDIVPKCRPRNNQYQEYDFPKSRRIGDETDLFGFVKLTLKED